MEESSVHNMLGPTAFSCRLLKGCAAWVFPALVAGLALAAFTWNADAVFFGGNVYFSDGDCYARMTRVRLLQEHPRAPVHRHDFENYPIGTQPHTTAPLDYLIAGLARAPDHLDAGEHRFFVAAEKLSLAASRLCPAHLILPSLSTTVALPARENCTGPPAAAQGVP